MACERCEVIDLDGGVWWGSCDSCPDATDLGDEGEEFAEAIEKLKKLGWRIYKDDDGEWAHMCPSCVEDCDNG